jgi:hypothetical protein
MRFEFSLWLLILLASFGMVTAVSPSAGDGIVSTQSDGTPPPDPPGRKG